VRLYRKAEIRFKEERIPGKYKEQLREQYIYANESIVYLERALDDKSYKNFRGYQESTADNNQSWKELLKPVIWRYLRLGFFTVAVIWFFKIIMGATNNGLDQMNKFEIKMAKSIKQRLDDVKGIDEIKDEVMDIISIIRSPELYEEKGAKLFKGVMLTGEPGTGKTLLARAIAGEAGCNFIFCSGSDFDEMFVGVGARRVKQLFAEARKHEPCIIFIDEIDSLLSGSRRGGNETSSSRATLN